VHLDARGGSWELLFGKINVSDPVSDVVRASEGHHDFVVNRVVSDIAECADISILYRSEVAYTWLVVACRAALPVCQSALFAVCSSRVVHDTLTECSVIAGGRDKAGEQQRSKDE
jgi:hypothetical protein